MRLVAAAMVALSPSITLAQETVPGDRTYVLHSEAQGTCPPLDWHIVLSPDGVLSGTFARPDRKMIATVSGSILPHVRVERFGPSLGGDPQIQQFRMIASEISGHRRIADITGIIQPNGSMVAAVDGPGVACQNIKVPLFVATSP
jgi:hypothetical protein